MIYELTQHQIEALDEHDYTMLLAYGDTLTDQETISIGTGGDLLWEAEASRFNREVGEQVVQFGKRLRSTINNGSLADSYLLCGEGFLEVK